MLVNEWCLNKYMLVLLLLNIEIKSQLYPYPRLQKNFKISDPAVILFRNRGAIFEMGEGGGGTISDSTLVGGGGTRHFSY